jgi:hypothetical protein
MILKKKRPNIRDVPSIIATLNNQGLIRRPFATGLRKAAPMDDAQLVQVLAFMAAAYRGPKALNVAR